MSFIREKTYTLPITLARGLRIRARTKKRKKRRTEKPGGVRLEVRKHTLLHQHPRLMTIMPGHRTWKWKERWTKSWPRKTQKRHSIEKKKKNWFRLSYKKGVGREKLRSEKAHFENQEITTRTFHTQFLQIQMADRLGKKEKRTVQRSAFLFIKGFDSKTLCRSRREHYSGNCGQGCTSWSRRASWWC